VKKSAVIVLQCALVVSQGLFNVLPAAAAEATAESPAAAPTVAEKGKMLVAANGARLGPVYRVGAGGAAQIIIDGKMVTVPASTLSIVDDKLTTSLTKSEVLALH
jgi:hypothetical protein